MNSFSLMLQKSAASRNDAQLEAVPSIPLIARRAGEYMIFGFECAPSSGLACVLAKNEPSTQDQLQEMAAYAAQVYHDALCVVLGYSAAQLHWAIVYSDNSVFVITPEQQWVPVDDAKRHPWSKFLRTKPEASAVLLSALHGALDMPGG